MVNKNAGTFPVDLGRGGPSLARVSAEAIASRPSSPAEGGLRRLDITGLDGGTGCYLRSRGREIGIVDGNPDDPKAPRKVVTSKRPVWFRNLQPGVFDKDPEIYVVKDLPRPAADVEDFDAILPPRRFGAAAAAATAAPAVDALSPDAAVDDVVPAAQRRDEAIVDLVGEMAELRARLDASDRARAAQDAELVQLRADVAERDEALGRMVDQLETATAGVATATANAEAALARAEAAEAERDELLLAGQPAGAGDKGDTDKAPRGRGSKKTD